MRLIILFLLCIWSFTGYSGSGFLRHVTLPGMVLEDETLEPLEGAVIEVYENDSLILTYESDELGVFTIKLNKIDTFDIVVKLEGFHTQHHDSLIIESYKMESSLDIYLISKDKEPKDIHCGERCWCINHEKHDWIKDTTGVMTGHIYDSTNLEPIPFVTILLKIDGLIVDRAQTDFSGYYKLDSIPPDSQNFTIVSVGHWTLRIEKLPIKTAELWHLDIYLDRYERRYFSCGCCYSRYRYYDYYHEPPVNLFLEEEEWNEEIDLDSPITSFEEEQEQPGINAFPNPIIDMVTIERLPQLESFKIINHMGIELQIVQTNGNSTITLDLAHLKRGLYYIKYEEQGKEKLYGLVKK